jgi:hypothetical protein
VRFISGLAFAVVVAASGVACMSGDSNGNGLIPVLGTPPQKTEVFTGTINQGGTMFFAFAVSNVGDLNVTLTSAGPPSTVVMRIGLGLGSTTTCQIQVTKDTAAGDSSSIVVSQVPSASYCVGIGDIGNATGPVTFTITVVHT